MRQHTSGPGGPPPEAYARVTNPERFSPLHDLAERLLNELSRQYAVIREEGYDLDHDSDRNALSRPSVRLTPENDSEAPLQISFTSFPGLSIRLGKWCVERLPACGCDACGESIETTREWLDFLVHSTVAGHLREEIVLPRQNEDALRIIEIGEAARGRVATRRTPVSRAEAEAWVTSRSARAWAPWTRVPEKERAGR